jgi:hypothetical protein
VSRIKPCPKHTFTPFFPNKTFFLHLHIPPTRFHHLCRETRPYSSVEHAQTMAFPSTKHSKEQESGDEKETWCLSLPSLTLHTIVFLCVSFIHPTLEPSLTSIPSLPITSPSKPYFQHKHHRPTREKKMFESLRVVKLLYGCNNLPLFLLVVTIYHWIEKFFSIKTHENLLLLLLD